MKSVAQEHHGLSGGFVVIIAFKFFKAVVFALVGIAALRLARLPQTPTVQEIARFLRVSPENQVILQAATVLRDITPGQAIRFGAASLLVAGILTAESLLLSFQVSWSTYLTLFLTACGIPIEIFDIFRRPGSLRRYALLLINIAILAYLWRRRNDFRKDSAETEL